MLQIDKYETQREKPGNVHSPELLPAGTNVYLIRHKKSGKVYRYCYLLREDAELSSDNIIQSVTLCTRPDAAIEYNFYNDPEHCEHIISLSTGKEE